LLLGEDRPNFEHSKIEFQSKMYSTMIQAVKANITDDDLFELQSIISQEIKLRYKHKSRSIEEKPKIKITSTTATPLVSPIITNAIEEDSQVGGRTDNMKAYKRWYYLKPRVAAGLAKEKQIAEFYELNRIFGK